MKEKQARIEISLSLLRLRDAELKIREMESRIEEGKAKVDLYKEQAKGYRDQTKLNSIKLIFNTWSTMYTQNQIDSHPAFTETARIEDTIQKWFTHLEMDNPNT